MSLVVRRLGERVVIAVLAAALAAAPLRAQQAPPDPASYIFLATVADRGLNCGLLKPWQVAAILSEAGRLLNAFEEADRDGVIAQATEQAAATPCDDAGVNQWIQGATPGIEREWLPPNLALYRALATMDEPPQLFLDIVGDTDLTSAVASIDAQIASFEIGGLVAEGGLAWDDYLSQIADVAAQIVSAAAGEPDAAFPQDDATSYIVDAAVIVTLWLSDPG